MQKLRPLIAVVAIAFLVLIGLARPAAAAEEGNYKDKASEECAHLLAEGGTIDECQAAPNPLVPEKNELIWGVIGFGLVFAFLTWKALPAMRKGMNARTDRIQGDLDTAEAQREEATQILADYKAQLADARNESARIIEEARQSADEVKQTLTAKAQADIADLRTKATADIEAAKVQAIADLRGEVANLAIGAAEQVVERSLDRDTSVALVEAYINQVGADR